MICQQVTTSGNFWAINSTACNKLHTTHAIDFRNICRVGYPPCGRPHVTSITHLSGDWRQYNWNENDFPSPTNRRSLPQLQQQQCLLCSSARMAAVPTNILPTDRSSLLQSRHIRSSIAHQGSSHIQSNSRISLVVLASTCNVYKKYQLLRLKRLYLVRYLSRTRLNVCLLYKWTLRAQVS